MIAILTAAGYGTRMGEIAKGKPKTLLEVGGRPVIEHCIEKISEIKDVDMIVVVSNNRFYDYFEEWKNRYHSPIELRILNDGTNNNEERLGTIGDINFVLREAGLDDDFMVINADNVFLWGLREAYDDFKSRYRTTIGLVNASSLEEARRKGNPKVDENMRVIDFIEKDMNTKSTLSSIGIYFFPSNIKARIKEYLDEGNPPDRSGDFIAWLHRREEVYGHHFGESRDRLFDIGSPESYKEANDFFAAYQHTKK